ncbi:Acyl transferase domain-containing protein [Allokutzneria albata]|uniref:Acyl transferase domain-containing protein n=1 Tax=Allokutzneria albata TaxID=211114 RepID=A0A1G9VYK6_ALLAB|nr:Acyl transferase domain-containing protein [Allokutzneria albata]
MGMSVLLPGAPDLESYWRNLVDGVDSITEVPEGRWDAEYYKPSSATGKAEADEIYCRRGGFVDAYAEVDPTRFGIMPNSVAGTEPDQLIALRVAAAAIADAGGDEKLPARDRIGVVLGRGGYLTPGLVRLEQRVRTAHQLVRTLSELMPDLPAEKLESVRAAFTEQLGPHQPESAIGLVPNLAASRIANRLDLRGPAYTVDAACASSLIAVDQAVTELSAGRCDVMLAGGVHHCHDVTFWSVFSQLRALSTSQSIRPFSKNADGILIGEGTGVVVLKRLEDAQRDGDRVYAVIRGTGVASDGKAASLFNPEPDGQVLALQRAWAAAGLDPTAPDAIGMLEAHGTATPAGDAAELDTLRRIFGSSNDSDDFPVIGSVKSMIGHTMPAAGIAGLVKAALAVHRGVLLPTLHCEEPHPALAETRFRPISAARPWETSQGKPRRAAVNAFGFGGINAHVVLEQASAEDPVAGSSISTAGTPVVVSEPEQVLRLSASSPAELAKLLEADDAELRAMSFAEGSPLDTRLGIVGPTTRKLTLARKVAAKAVSWRGRNDVWFSPSPLLGAPSAKIAFVFPGLEADFEPRMDDVAAHFGLPERELSGETVGAHGEAVFSMGRMLDTVLRRSGITPDGVAGHSVGEWTAMVAAGIYSDAEIDSFLQTYDPDALKVPGVAFAALGCGVDRIADALAARPELVLSHDNAPNQCMVCGPVEVVEDLVREMRGKNVLGQLLPFQSGFHTPMLEPFMDPIHTAVNELTLHPATLPIWSATTASPYPTAEAAIRELFVRHLLEPVRFRQLVEAMYADGYRVFIQTGTGQLASLISDTLRGQEHLAVVGNAGNRSGMEQLRRVATALWVEGGAPAQDLFGQPAPAAPAPSKKAGRPPMRLDLNGALVSLNGSVPPISRPAADAEDPLAGSSIGTGALGKLGNQFPLAAQLEDLLRETADTAAAVIGAARTAAAPVKTVSAPRELHEKLAVNTTAMPYLLDHCFFRQRANWPDETDRWPIVPATTLVQHMMDAAERSAPGQRAVTLHDVKFNRWMVSAPGIEVDVNVVPENNSAPHRVEVSITGYCQATVELAPSYAGQVPAVWPPFAGEQTPELTGEELYTKRWMFHGPLFQGVTALTGVSEHHVRGTITTPPAPGALLDNVGQILGYWIMSRFTEKKVVFPVGMRSIRFFGPHPAAGVPLECVIGIRGVSDTLLEADMQLLLPDGTLWAHIESWVDRRFDSNPKTEPVERFPERNTISERQHGGWYLLHELWPDLASRDLIMRNHLSAVERAEYETRSPRTRRQWLLGRIVAKDAVRQQLWAAGAPPLFPGEVRVGNEPTGRPFVTGRHGTEFTDTDVSIAHCREVGVAITRPVAEREVPGIPGIGIDVEEVAERDDSTVAFALSTVELELLDALVARTGETRALWFTRFFTAKEAVSKAEGTGLQGAPRNFVVEQATGVRLVVSVGQRRYLVHSTEASNAEGLPERHYVVAWTTGLAHEEETL